ncbi:hypothetical protein [Helicobacter fennelliae]|uniref:Uncharacterized protein n=1 Tax=Helicobacter fennelliae MRY12-0050 TaxID=1325130 RepID=T1DWM5_9HELI|nr:hypothetical protein [Helicobacter fennelliae]GAD19537.1 hypothetical protein HFN_0777 [Helicobacter fennelliae MRY12-0050]
MSFLSISAVIQKRVAIASKVCLRGNPESTLPLFVIAVFANFTFLDSAFFT